jgi:oxygen-independent coproporphyrinogen-3 oxidase
MAGAAPPLGLYVHLPWCVRKCPYCDFNSHQLTSDRPPLEYIASLVRDFERELPDIDGRRVETVFFGGGTPSLFDPDQFAQLLAALRARIEFAPNVEITLEANPGTIERGRFAGYRDAGINRVSLGAQSFEPQALTRLGRIHTPDDTFRAVEELRAAGIVNFNLDLMYALPGQSPAAARADVLTACGLEPTHISYYQLTLEPGTVFHARPPALPDEDAAWQTQLEGQALLADAGFEQYEVSAYARAGAECRHNLNYWTFGDYVGIGAGAHGKLTLELPGRVLRTAKPKQPRDYQAQIASDVDIVGERRCVAIGDLPFEFMLNALRLNGGFTSADFTARTGLGLDPIRAQLTAQEDRGLLEQSAHGWRATPLGLRFLNDLQAAFLA